MSDDAVVDLTKGVYRRLHGGFIKGQRINRLSLPAEAWFWRVVATVDDFGNGDADQELCRAATSGRRKVTARQVGGWLNEMAEVGLISLYEAKGERFLHVNGFEERQPAGKNGKRMQRFPFPEKSKGIQVNPDSSSASNNHNHNHTKNDKEHTRSTAAQVRTVFDFWREHLNHPKAILDSKRERVISSRLKAGYSIEDLCAAIQGCALTPYNMGENGQQKIYDDIELICRDATHVERFMEKAATGNVSSHPRFMASAK